MDTQTLTTERLVLEPLRVEHAEEMAPVLDDPGLHDRIGGKPPTLEQLRRRYRLQVVGRSPDGSQRWLNWILRSQESGRVVGFVQATVTRDDDRRVAEIAWVVGTAAQGRGYAKEATHAMVSWPLVGARLVAFSRGSPTIGERVVAVALRVGAFERPRPSIGPRAPPIGGGVPAIGRRSGERRLVDP
jgi:hypothetical protein